LSTLLNVENLSTIIQTPGRTIQALNKVCLKVNRGETLAIVGESGCGKSMTALSILRLLPPGGKTVSGTVNFDGIDLLRLSDYEMRSYRGNRIAMIFQEPMTSLNPVLTIGSQISEGIMLHQGFSRKQSKELSIELLHKVGISSSEERFSDYPHQLSGGMRQRTMIAMAISSNPRLLIADEPTTALDVTIQAQILDLLSALQKSTSMGMILITHDLGIVAENSQHCMVMYAGEIVESANTETILTNPLHPYTRGLLDSLPQRSRPGEVIPTIMGHSSGLEKDTHSCPFSDRCQEQFIDCRSKKPDLTEVGKGHFVRCWKCR
jgi:peptide/nickel transport system ATP-binding protein